ncbi:MAG TPA: hypothetical protein DCS23_01445 [Candidatus Yonathbacteria bacterium]|nr:hypothetical protein [Candidatus Yonathbacteria bacterium]
MNNIIFQSIRAIAVFAIALFAFVSDVFAAPMLTPVTAKYITGESATIIGHVSNPHKNSTVWFEIYNSNNAPTAVAVQGIWNEGTFEWNLRDLNPGQTYSYRSVAMEGGATVYSPISSFTTLTPKPTAINISYQSNSSDTQSSTKTTKGTSSTVEKQSSAINTVEKQTNTTEKQINTTSVVAKDGFNNNNTATVINAGDGIFPTTLIGWAVLIIAILSAILIGRIIYETTEKHKKDDDDEDKDEEEVETE